MPTPIILEGLLAKIEGTYRSDPTPVVGTDGVRLAERGWSALNIEYGYPNQRENTVSGTLLPVAPGAPKGRIVTAVIELELTGYGSAYSASNLPPAHMFWRGSGYSQTVDATGGSENVKYQPADSSHESFTMWAYGAGNVYKVNGCRCNPIWPINAGELGRLRFEVQGFLDTDPAAASLPSITYTAQVPPPAVSGSITVGAVTLDSPATLELNGGVELVRVPDVNDASGFSEIAIARHRPTVQLRTLVEALGTYDPYTDRDTPTLRTIDATVGSAQYNRADLDINNAYVDTIAHAEQDGLAAWDLGYLSTDLAVIYD